MPRREHAENKGSLPRYIQMPGTPAAALLKSESVVLCLTFLCVLRPQECHTTHTLLTSEAQRTAARLPSRRHGQNRGGGDSDTHKVVCVGCSISEVLSTFRSDHVHVGGPKPRVNDLRPAFADVISASRSQQHAIAPSPLGLKEALQHSSRRPGLLLAARQQSCVAPGFVLRLSAGQCNCLRSDHIEG